jgi:SAM-dependent methyltransferase
VSQLVDTLTFLLDRGGPDPADYDALGGTISAAWTALAAHPDAARAARDVHDCFCAGFLRETVHGHVLSKPMGYAGDFLMIDRIYRRAVSPFEPYERWDEYFHSRAAPRAVRRRKAYFKELLDATRARHAGPMRILNIGTGPGRDIAEYLANEPRADIQVVSVDLDPRASAYARQVIGTDEPRVTLITENAFRFTSPHRFHLIWSAGLFDYLSDRLFLRLVRRLQGLLDDEGSIVVGNFSVSNPSRAYMELLGDWHLEHRSPVGLLELGRRAGYSDQAMRVGSEPLGVNLFLHLKGVAARSARS